MRTIDVDHLRQRLRGARVLALTGAGVSVASGLPTYRGAEDSLYQDPEALRDCFASTLRRDPARFWARFVERRALLRRATPNAGHAALAALERAAGGAFLLATQNVDDLHRRAGSARVVELHGNALLERCLDLDEHCGAPVWRSESDALAGAAPACPRCAGPARPDVVLFGEGADARWEPARAFVAGGPVDVVLLVGTAGVVEVPTQLVELARSRGAPYVVELNPRPSDAPGLAGLVDAHLVARAEEALPALG
jgi:NAD-dependent deacetylase